MWLLLCLMTHISLQEDRGYSRIARAFSVNSWMHCPFYMQFCFWVGLFHFFGLFFCTYSWSLLLTGDFAWSFLLTVEIRPSLPCLRLKFGLVFFPHGGKPVWSFRTILWLFKAKAYFDRKMCHMVIEGSEDHGRCKSRSKVALNETCKEV